MHIPYIHNGNFNKNIIKFGIRKLFIGLIDCYTHLLNALLILSDNNIVHYDLKNDNILYDSVKQQPIIIDFGLSINMKPILKICSKKKSDFTNSELKLLREKFYVFAPDYYLWCLDIHFISFFLNGSKYDLQSQTNSTTDGITDMTGGGEGGSTKISRFNLDDNILTKEFVKDICTMYVTRNKTLRLFSKDFRLQYLKNSIKYFNRYVGKKPHLVIKSLIANWKSWDTFSVSIMYIKIIYSIFNIKQNKTLDFFYETLLQNIHYDPNKRMLPLDSLSKFKEIFYSGDDLSSLFSLLNTYNLDKESITKKLDDDIEGINTIIKKALR